MSVEADSVAVEIEADKSDCQAEISPQLSQNDATIVDNSASELHLVVPEIGQLRRRSTSIGDRMSVTFAPDAVEDPEKHTGVITHKSPSSVSKNNFTVMLSDSGDNAVEHDTGVDMLSSLSSNAARLSGSSSDKHARRQRNSSGTSSSGGNRKAKAKSVGKERAIFEQIKLHKEIIAEIKHQTIPLQEKIELVSKAKQFIVKHEGELAQKLTQHRSATHFFNRSKLVLIRYWPVFKRGVLNVLTYLLPWENRIKRVECHFGTAVASYFTFLRWVLALNIGMCCILMCFTTVPEFLSGDSTDFGERKGLLVVERLKAYDLKTLWDFEGAIKYSPLFYGYYNQKFQRTDGYNVPLGYFLAGMMAYLFSFALILRTMAGNAKMNKMASKDDNCEFTWSLLTGWDFSIGHTETALNKVAALNLKFRETMLEEREKERDENWRVLAKRVTANVLVLALLVLSACAVVLLVQRSTNSQNATWWQQNELTLTMTLISNVFPMIFDKCSALEGYHPRKKLRLQLARIMVLNLLNMYTLIFALFGRVDNMTEQLQTWKTQAASITAETSREHSVIYYDNSSFYHDTDNVTMEFCYNISLNCSSNETVVIANRTMNTMNQTYFSYAPDYRNASYSTNSTESIDRIHLLTSSTSESITLVSSSSTPLEESTSSEAASSSTMSTHSLFLPHSEPVPFDRKLNEPSISTELSPPIHHKGDTTSSSTLLSTDSQPMNSSNWTPSESTNPQSEENQISSSTQQIVNRSENETRDIENNTWILFEYFDENSSDQLTSTSGTPTDEQSVEHTQTGLTNVGSSENLVEVVYYSEKHVINEHEETTKNITSNWNISESLNNSENQHTTDIIDIIPTQAYSTDGTIETVNSTEDSTEGKEPQVDPANTTPDDLSVEEICAKLICHRNNTTLRPKVANEREGFTKTKTITSREFNSTVRVKLRQLCWETMFGQELIKLIVMDTVWSAATIVVMEFVRAALVRSFNHYWCWDLERVSPKYADFSIAENILHLVNNQGMVWMGMFFAPGLPLLNAVKLVILLYVRSWGVLTSNVPHEVVFRASRSNNFYYALLLVMLFLVTLPVGYAVVWLEPSWHCGPFSDQTRIYHVFTETLQQVLPAVAVKVLTYLCSASVVIPLLLLLFLVIMYQMSLASSLRETAADLRLQLRRERTDGRRQMFKMADTRTPAAEQNTASRWSQLLGATASPAAGKRQRPQLSQEQQEKNAKAIILAAVHRRRERKKLAESGNSTVSVANPV